MHVEDSTTIVTEVGSAVRLQASIQVEQRSIADHPSHLRLSNMLVAMTVVDTEECLAAIVTAVDTEECVVNALALLEAQDAEY